MPDPLELLWMELLSRQPARIRAAFTALPRQQKISVRAHLIRMTSEPDWHTEQALSARAALEALRDIPDN